jgi:CheY-like chemotaxis protein
MLRIRKASLEGLGYVVTTALSAPDAITILENIVVTAVLLDYKQEGLDAQAVASHIKQRFPNIRVILLSAYTDLPQGMLRIVDEYVTKTEPVERLREVIERRSESRKQCA